ncbi:GNAT family N-acetyltransferase [Microbacterium lushaniae]|nr:GNAT family N-acetyltransferase [Microbacterium lushaniae]KAA9153144.1 GNAT family N-acetyltransferase [Microbacterium lushaniae]
MDDATPSGGALKLRRRTAEDCEVVVGWVPDAEQMYLFTGHRLTWPLTPRQLLSMESTAGFYPWVFASLDHPVGHFDITVKHEDAWIGRVIIDPARRGQGLARMLLWSAVTAAKGLHCTSLNLNVIVGNTVAIRAYERAGFRVVPNRSTDDVFVMRLPIGSRIT